MGGGLRQKAVNGIIWTGGEKILFEIVHFVIGLVLARLLTPSDYGIIGMLAIFIAISNSFLDSGFSSALIQKKDCTNIDYSTAFYFNLLVALLFYGLLFISAPWIAQFYQIPILTQVTRVVSLSLILNGLIIVPTAKLTIELDFRSQAIASLSSILFSGILGILLAYQGYGVWALVWQSISLPAIRGMILWITARWWPIPTFSKESFKSLFSFGSKLLCSGMINTIYSNIYPFIIGKFFGAADIGFFNRANQFASLPANTVTGVVIKVNFPILVALRDDREKLIRAYRKLIRTPLSLLFPALWGMAALAHPLVSVLLGEQWIPCVPFLQILCISAVCTPLTHINLNLLYVKGRSDLVLRLELIKKPIAFAILFASLPFGLIGLCIGWAIYDFVAFAFNCYYTKKLLDYGLICQLKELFPLMVRSAIMVGAVLMTRWLSLSPILHLLLGVFVGGCVYLGLSLLDHDETISDIWQELIERIHSKNKGKE